MGQAQTTQTGARLKADFTRESDEYDTVPTEPRRPLSVLQKYLKWEDEMFQASLGSCFGAQEYGLHASISAAVAYDELCSLYKIEIALEPQAVIIAGRVPPAAAKRAREIIVEVCGPVSVWDRTFWL